MNNDQVREEKRQCHQRSSLIFWVWSDVQDWYEKDPRWHLERRYARANTLLPFTIRQWTIKSRRLWRSSINSISTHRRGQENPFKKRAVAHPSDGDPHIELMWKYANEMLSPNAHTESSRFKHSSLKPKEMRTARKKISYLIPTPFLPFLTDFLTFLAQK